jgi:hypothetical protein
MFNNTPPAQAPVEDPVREAMKKANAGIGPKGIPEGEGTYVVDKLHPGIARTGAKRMQIRFVCETHSDPSKVGQVFEHHLYYTGSGGRDMSMILGDVRRFLILPFGPEAAAGIQSQLVEDMIVNGYKEEFATMIRNQGITLADGSIVPFKGKRIKLTCKKNQGTGIDRKTGKPVEKTFYNVYADVA